ncbi:MAG: M23 family metallopeptidase, partial [Oscillospiraceae bacterium]
MSNNPYEESKFAHFVSGRGFYVILTACIIGVSCALAVSVKDENKSLKPNEDNPPAVELKQNEIRKDPAQELGPQLEKRKEETEKPKEAEKAQNENAKDTPTPVAKMNTSFMMPCDGEIISNFSSGELVKDETMGDWRTHNGIDIKAETKAPVKAAASGKVTRVYN